jgi:hypothetical protein
MRTDLTSRLVKASAALAVAGLALFAAAGGAEARDGYGWRHQHWNNGWHGGWNNGWSNRGWNNGWQRPNVNGYTWPQRYWNAPTYYGPPQAYSYYPEPMMGRGLTFTIPLP